MVAVSTLGSHCSLQVLKGAKDEGLDTILVCEEKRMGLYGRFPFIDRIVPVSSFRDMSQEPCASALRDSVLIPHGTLIAQMDPDAIESLPVRMFGNRRILRWESDRALKEKLMAAAGLPVPESVASPGDISGPVIVKRQGAAGGKGYFMASTPEQYHSRRDALMREGTISPDEPLYIQEYVSGVLAYLQFFYSPLRDEVEFFGCDQRHESDIEGLARIPASSQRDVSAPSFNVIGNTPMFLRESLLDGAYRMAEDFVRAAQKMVEPGMTGPFCIEGVYDGDGRFTAFEFSARIVAGTNIYMDGSPYYTLLFGEPLSMGRRMAREIGNAHISGRLDSVTT